MRKDLNMRKGKMVAQGSHASVQATVKNINKDEVQKWLSEGMRKICVSCKDEKELLELYQQAVAAGLVCSIIRDAGATEFKGVPTLTCIAIGPAKDEEVDKITKDLKLL